MRRTMEAYGYTVELIEREDPTCIAAVNPWLMMLGEGKGIPIFYTPSKFDRLPPICQKYVVLHELGHLLEEGGYTKSRKVDQEVEKIADGFAFRVMGPVKFTFAVFMVGIILHEDPEMVGEYIARQFIKEVKK